MTIKRVFVLVAATLATAACAAPAPSKQTTALRGRDCLFFRSLYDLADA